MDLDHGGNLCKVSKATFLVQKAEMKNAARPEPGTAGPYIPGDVACLRNDLGESLPNKFTVSRRWLVSFSFGLVHGSGFSSALRELGLPAHGLLLSLFGFNLGVEIGQALVVAIALPRLLLLRRTQWEKRAVLTSSLVIFLIGLALFVERALL